MDVMMEVKDEEALGAEARMKAPLEWYSSAKCKILDLKEPQYDEALRLIKVQLQDHGVAVLSHSARSCKLLSTSTAPLLSRGGYVQGVLVAARPSVRERLSGARKNVVEGHDKPGRHQP
ncbi:hypothetical protein K0M31_003235 [Melipona bicolor]|uniref:Uncharacterized protein n=1 Tax=Melipona bicolor TaxID=60889 RepID=A0AA40FYJ1_9HYME|nr:hypothetical protein K0M31_003235 [Melipona bicolor]